MKEMLIWQDNEWPKGGKEWGNRGKRASRHREGGGEYQKKIEINVRGGTGSKNSKKVAGGSLNLRKVPDKQKVFRLEVRVAGGRREGKEKNILAKVRKKG